MTPLHKNMQTQSFSSTCDLEQSKYLVLALYIWTALVQPGGEEAFQYVQKGDQEILQSDSRTRRMALNENRGDSG